ncbi:MAG: FAD-binding oxidoreductase [Saprospiraceae bacterium]|nr:FAD-binding oxidoreductase [Saprospiraceae bacterium]
MTTGLGTSLSYWERTAFLQKHNLIIIGTGIVGLSAALSIKSAKPNWSILVIDRGTLPQGASTKNAGFACFGSPSELLADMDASGWDTMVEFVQKRWKGLKMLRNLVSDQGLNYQACGGYEVFDDTQFDLWERCTKALQQLNQSLSFIGKDVFKLDTQVDDHGLKRFHGLISCQYEAAINPGKMMRTLMAKCHAQEIHFLNGVEVSSIHDNGDSAIVDAHGIELESDFLLLATNAFTPHLVPGIDLYPARNQVIVTSPIPNLKLKGVYHHDFGYVYFRPVENRILLGGARHRFGTQEHTDQLSNTDNVVLHLEDLLRNKIIPNQHFTIDYQWSGILGLGSKKSPILEWRSDRIFMACRMGGMGISIGALVGQAAADQIVSR